MSAWGWVIVVLGVVLAGLATAFVTYLLPTDDQPRAPDAVVVLGGGGPERTELGLELVERYDAQLVLASTAAIFGEQRGRCCSVDALCFEPDPPTTRGEAQGVARMAEEQGWDHITVATSAFHTSRSRFLFRQCLGDRVTVVGARLDGRPATTPRLLLREAAGVLAGATIQRAC